MGDQQVRVDQKVTTENDISVLRKLSRIVVSQSEAV